MLRQYALMFCAYVGAFPVDNFFARRKELLQIVNFLVAWIYFVFTKKTFCRHIGGKLLKWNVFGIYRFIRFAFGNGLNMCGFRFMFGRS